MNTASKLPAVATGLAAAIVFGALGACDSRSPSGEKAPPPVSSTEPDNTARNQRDRDSSTPTAQDQGQTKSDLDITAEIRKSVMSDSAMSVNGQNCKIITSGGIVTLRGPVESQAEKDSIAAKAKAVPGVISVMNELEVKPR